MEPKVVFLLFGISLLFAMTACTLNPQPAHVEILHGKNGYELLVEGKPFMVKGVGSNAIDPARFEILAEIGGNTIRTWGADQADTLLALAAKHDLMVALGIYLGQELHGFDYTDEQAVANQLAKSKAIVDRYKDHPNLLCWVAGNELNLAFDEAGQLRLVHPNTYRSLQELVTYIHEVDPHHPVTTTMAGYDSAHIALVQEHCPDLDLLSFQVYGALYNIQSDLQTLGFTDPYFITEYGPMGHWEQPTTSWGREIEEPSSLKAQGFRMRMERGFAPDSPRQNLGGFAFLWGQKQERTPTWYGMFLADGSRTETMEELQQFWTGKYPEIRAPKVKGLLINQQEARQNIRLQPNTQARASLTYEIVNSEPRIRWELRKEVTQRSEGGAFEQTPDSVPLTYESSNGGSIFFQTPEVSGAYRLFVYVYNETGQAGYANIPFYVGEFPEEVSK